MTKEELKNLKFIYEDKINVPQNPFGIEIEFEEASYNQIEKDLMELFNYEYVPKSKWSREIKKDYTKWQIGRDATVETNSQENNFETLGGEIKTPIMANEKKYWEELKQVCELLRSNPRTKITGKCSIHIHSDKKIYTNLEEYKNLLKLIMIYEDIIYKFSYGEKNTPRELIFKFAKPMSYKIYGILDKLEIIETEQQLVKLLDNERKYEFNFKNIVSEEKQTIEKRTSNGTLNEKIIQNDVRFTLNLLKYAKIENFDKEFINYKLKNFEPFVINQSIKEFPKKAEELANMIYEEKMDKLMFFKQYYKAFKPNEIAKKHFS